MDLRAVGGDELCHEWVDSRGVIAPTEVPGAEGGGRAGMPRSDMAVTALVLALLRTTCTWRRTKALYE